MSKSGCILQELKGHVAPLELLEKISEQNPSAQGLAWAVEGSGEVLVERSVSVLSASEYYALRAEVKDQFTMVSWFGNGHKEGFTEPELQPFTLLQNEADKPVLVMFAEGVFTPLFKKDEALYDEFRLAGKVSEMVNELVDQHEGDMAKVLSGMQQSMFGRVLDTFAAGRYVITFVAGDGTIFQRSVGNDKGYEADWGSVSDSYGYRPASAGPAEDKTLLGPAAALRARMGLKPGTVASASATTPAEHLKPAGKPAVKNVLAFTGSSATATASSSGGTDPTTAPQPNIEDAPDGKDLPTHDPFPEGETVEGTTYPPKEWLSQQWNKHLVKKVEKWYRRNNTGRVPLEWQNAWKLGHPIGVKAGQEPWYTEHELKKMAEEKANNARANANLPPAPASQGKFRSFSAAGPALKTAATTPAAPSAPGHIVKPTSAEAKAVIARANDPTYDEAFIAKMAKEFLSTDPVIQAISFDDTVMITPEEIQKLDRPKASPLSAVFGFKSWADMRWDMSITDSLVEKCVKEGHTRFISEMIHELKYRVVTLETDKTKGQVITDLSAGKPALIGPAARLIKKVTSLGAA